MPGMVYPRFNGALLRRLRKKAGFSLRALAVEFYTQFGHYTAYQAIDLWEQGRHQPKGHHLVMLASILDVEAAVFYKYEGGDMPPVETSQQRQI